MKRKMILTFVAALFFGIAASAQENAELKENSELTDNKSVNANEDEVVNVVSHKVLMGETVMLIAKKYHITPKDIYELNPDATKGISYNMMINIPADKINKKYDRRATTGHLVSDKGEE
ncbi:LysM peptidoglycan-binding domain-containing protein [Flavobacterium sp. RHBU_24]|uniref:LysM peptidoglycan-binding domain-containing protein n=1 Tax=Flavobacterium sp. RHBU_24 TaxID=3391185 RepID=UPI003984DCD9